MKKITQVPFFTSILVAVGGAAIITIVLLAFVWPSETATLKYLPLALVAPEHVEQMPPMLAYADKDQFRLSIAPSRQAAVDLIKSRQVYGAVVLGDKPEVLIASANGGVVNQLMGEVRTHLQSMVAANAAAQGNVHPAKVILTDVVPTAKSSFDLALLSLPLIIGGIIGGGVGLNFANTGNLEIGHDSSL